MAFVTNYHMQHNIAARVDVSDVSPREPIRIRIGEVSAYLSREEAAQLGAELLSAAGAVPVEVEVDVLAGERDARTIYDIACIREEKHGASREDLEFKAIALRNYQFCAAVADLIEDHKALYRHYVNALESARDRIIDLGGDCDPVDKMEQSDPVLARSRAVLTHVGGAK